MEPSNIFGKSSVVLITVWQHPWLIPRFRKRQHPHREWSISKKPRNSKQLPLLSKSLRMFQTWSSQSSLEKPWLAWFSKNISRYFFNRNWKSGHCEQALVLFTFRLCFYSCWKARCAKHSTASVNSSHPRAPWPLTTITLHPIITAAISHKEMVPFPSSNCTGLLLVPCIFPITLRKIKQNWQ